MENDKPVKRVIGDKEVWVLNEKLHRVDGPAFIAPGVCERWHIDDKKHRVDGPAEIWEDGTECWYLKGVKISEEDFRKAHECPREDLPLLIGTRLEPIAKWRLENGK